MVLEATQEAVAQYTPEQFFDQLYVENWHQLTTQHNFRPLGVFDPGFTVIRWCGEPKLTPLHFQLIKSGVFWNPRVYFTQMYGYTPYSPDDPTPILKFQFDLLDNFAWPIRLRADEILQLSVNNNHGHGNRGEISFDPRSQQIDFNFKPNVAKLGKPSLKKPNPKQILTPAGTTIVTQLIGRIIDRANF